MKYLKNDKKNSKLLRTEIFFSPFLVLIPFIVGSYFIIDWYNRGFVDNQSGVLGSLIIGLIIIIGNIIFDIPFVKSIIRQMKSK